MRIVIIGAGIAGCTAYLHLKKNLPTPPSGEEHEITIYEAYDTNKDTTSTDREQDDTHSSTLIVGGGFGVGVNGLNVLERLDDQLLRDAVSNGYVIANWNMKTKHGASLMKMHPSVETSDGEKTHQTHLLGSSRHALWRTLRVRIPDTAIVTKKIAKVVANADGLNTVSFADGSPSVEADLVLGADGLKSTTKRALFPDSKEDPYPANYEGLVGIGGFIPTDEIKEHVELGSMNMILGGGGAFGYFYTESSPSAPNRDSLSQVSEPGDKLLWYSTYSADVCPDTKTIDLDDVTRQLRERHQGWQDPVLQKVLKDVRVENMWPTWTVPELPIWQREGVVLVGDAAHALPPSSGQGVSQALEDVESLTMFLSHAMRKAYASKESGATDNKKIINSAAAKYQALRKPHVQNILQNARQQQNRKREKGVVSEYVMYATMWALGWFPSIISAPMEANWKYNVAEEVDRILKQEE